jgi:hypothetical protein
MNAAGGTMNASERPTALYLQRRRVLPYFVVGVAWFVFLLFALRVRLMEPVFLWVLTQSLLVERVSHGFWSSRGVLLAAYMAAAFAAWWLVERTGRDPRHVWRRAVLAWIGIQIAYCLTATILVQAGILYE